MKAYATNIVYVIGYHTNNRWLFLLYYNNFITKVVCKSMVSGGILKSGAIIRECNTKKIIIKKKLLEIEWNFLEKIRLIKAVLFEINK